MKLPAAALILIVADYAWSASVAAPAPSQPEIYSALLACRTVEDKDARLTCFEQATDRLEAAAQKGEVVVVDRQEIRKTKKTLFGLPLPSLGILGDGADKEDQVNEVDGVVAAAGRSGDGRWTLTLADGARWQQIDDRPLAFEPKRGDPVIIRRAALGSFMMKIKGQQAIRVRRFL
jgi:hypothetical protein